MSIYVDPNETFPITLKFEYIRTPDGKVAGVKILPEESTGPKVQSLICQAAGRDYDTMSRILEETTLINHITGKPVVRHSLFRRFIVLRFVRSWDAQDENGNPIPITWENLGKIRYEIVKSIAKKWLKMTTDHGE